MKRLTALLSALSVLALGACSINQMAVRLAGNALSGAASSSGNAFTSDNDPELVAQSLPTMIKLSESLLASDPANPALGRSLGSMYIMYANAFVEGPSLLLPPKDFDRKVEAKARALNLYLRGVGYLRAAIEHRHPGSFRLLEGGEGAVALRKFSRDEVPYLYWYAAGAAAAFALDPLDVASAAQVPVILAMAERARGLDPGFSNGSVQDLLISVYGSLPEGLGGSRDKAKDAFSKAVEASKGRTVSPYVAYALGIAIPAQDYAGFTTMLGKALAVDVEAYPPTRLANVLGQRKARWYLDHASDFFDLDTD